MSQWIGLTGGIASGKTTVTEMLRELGVAVIEADVIARQVVSPGSEGLNRVISQFGTGILNPDGSLDRRKLGREVFADPKKRQELEALLHPLIKAEVSTVRNQFLQEGRQLVVYDVPLLFEKNMQKEFDGIIVVTSDLEKQKSRMKARDLLSDAEIGDRLASQIPMTEKIAQATWVLSNNGSQGQLQSQVQQLIAQMEPGKE
jgi:dephospho-CoA kinase